ncbi:MAG: adenylate/guanylate cyclase domain-containing protein [Elusimicrobiota bacterium]|nr:adenylate/guanylate cyclase domain-containing protein [Elusimicrobiota bacterium]
MGAPLLLAAVLSAGAAGAVTLPRLSRPRLAADRPVTLSAPLLDLRPAAGVYERRGVGLLAVDLRDSTALHRAIGNRKAHAWTAAVLDLAEATARDFDGAVVRRMGDGYLMVFPEAERAMRAAAALQENLPAWREKAGAPPLELRSAVHAGRVLVDARGKSPEAYGQSVERALALADKSEGGEVALFPELADSLLARGWDRRASLRRGDGVSLLRLRPAASAALAPPRPAAPAEFVEAATLFASLVDWPAVFERYGRRRAYATVKAFHAHAAAIVERHGGALVKTSGDTVMATFPTPGAAVAAGLELQARLGDLRRASPLGRLVAARVGISSGRALREEGGHGVDYFGNTVNAAARLMKRAAPGEVLVAGRSLESDPAAAALMAGAALTYAEVKGFPEPIPMAGVTPPPAPADRAASRRLRQVAAAAIAAVPPPATHNKGDRHFCYNPPCCEVGYNKSACPLCYVPFLTS